VPERRRLDAEAGHRAAQGDRLELRYYQRHEPVRQRGVAEILIGGHAAHNGGLGGHVDVDHVRERGHVEADSVGGGSRLGRVAEAEQVGRRLGQAHRDARRHRGVRVAQPRHRGLVRC
jgi:hypothetical protein